MPAATLLVDGNAVTKPEIGQCIINTIWILGCRHLEIVQADERVLIADEVLKAADSHPDVTLGDGILTIKALNGTVSYGIGKYDLLTNAYEAMRSPEGLA